VPRVVLLATAVVLLATACGPPGPKVYSESKSRACMVATRAKVTRPPATDFVATTALGGSFRATLRHNAVTVSFGDTVANADDLDGVYRTVHAHNVGIDDVLRQQGNAVMLWQQHPRDADLALVQGCLKT
jgi:hypothetical protein